MKKIILLICIMVIAGISLGAIYKWEDEEGRVHYSDNPTDKHKTKEVDVEPGPSPEEVDKAIEQAERQQQRSRTQQEQQQPSTEQSLEDLQFECDQARFAVKQLSKPGTRALHLESGGKIIFTDKGRVDQLRYYEKLIKQKCH